MTIDGESYTGLELSNNAIREIKKSLVTLMNFISLKKNKYLSDPILQTYASEFGKNIEFLCVKRNIRIQGLKDSYTMDDIDYTQLINFIRVFWGRSLDTTAIESYTNATEKERWNAVLRYLKTRGENYLPGAIIDKTLFVPGNITSDPVPKEVKQGLEVISVMHENVTSFIDGAISRLIEIEEDKRNEWHNFQELFFGAKRSTRGAPISRRYYHKFGEWVQLFFHIKKINGSISSVKPTDQLLLALSQGVYFKIRDKKRAISVLVHGSFLINGTQNWGPRIKANFSLLYACDILLPEFSDPSNITFPISPKELNKPISRLAKAIYLLRFGGEKVPEWITEITNVSRYIIDLRTSLWNFQDSYLRTLTDEQTINDAQYVISELRSKYD